MTQSGRGGWLYIVLFYIHFDRRGTILFIYLFYVQNYAGYWPSFILWSMLYLEGWFSRSSYFISLALVSTIYEDYLRMEFGNLAL